MALKKRERILAGAVGVLGLVFLGQFLLFSGPTQSIGELQRLHEKLSGENEKKRDTIARIHSRAAAQMAEWNRRSLPADPKVAQPLYVKWLVGLIEDADLEEVEFKPKTPTVQKGVYAALPFNVMGEGSLDELLSFLYEFYSAGHLHRIRRLSIDPIEGGERFQFDIDVEALCLVNSDNEGRLPDMPGNRLELEDRQAYREVFVRRRLESERFVDGRGLFTPYAPPPPPPPPPRPPVVRVEPKPPPPAPPPPPRFDVSKHAYVTGILEVYGVPEVWIESRAEGEKTVFHEGEPIEIGTVRGTVAHIDPLARCIQLEIDGRRHQVALGKSLYEAVNVPDEEL